MRRDPSLAAGAPLVAIKEWMGHADVQTTMIYPKWSTTADVERALFERASSSPSVPHPPAPDGEDLMGGVSAADPAPRIGMRWTPRLTARRSSL